MSFRKPLTDRPILHKSKQWEHPTIGRVMRPNSAEQRLKEYRSVFEWACEEYGDKPLAMPGCKDFRRTMGHNGPAHVSRTGSKQYFDMLRHFKKVNRNYTDCFVKACSARAVTDVMRMDKQLDVAAGPRLTLPILRKSDLLFNHNEPPKVTRRHEGGVFQVRRCRLPPSPRLVYKFARPLIHLDFAFGRVLIELYTAACPTVVWNLVRACGINAHKSFSVRSVVPEQWMDMRLVVSTDFVGMAAETFSYDSTQLSHCESGGVLSVDKNVFSGATSAYMPFAITFGEMPTLNKQRVACGRVMSGNKVLNTIRDSYEWIGRLPINILECGWYS